MNHDIICKGHHETPTALVTATIQKADCLHAPGCQHLSIPYKMAHEALQHLLQFRVAVAQRPELTIWRVEETLKHTCRLRFGCTSAASCGLANPSRGTCLFKQCTLCRAPKNTTEAVSFWNCLATLWAMFTWQQNMLGDLGLT